MGNSAGAGARYTVARIAAIVGAIGAACAIGVQWLALLMSVGAIPYFAGAGRWAMPAIFGFWLSLVALCTGYLVVRSGDWRMQNKGHWFRGGSVVAELRPISTRQHLINIGALACLAVVNIFAPMLPVRRAGYSVEVDAIGFAFDGNGLWVLCWAHLAWSSTLLLGLTLTSLLRKRVWARSEARRRAMTPAEKYSKRKGKREPSLMVATWRWLTWRWRIDSWAAGLGWGALALAVVFGETAFSRVPLLVAGIALISLSVWLSLNSWRSLRSPLEAESFG